MLGAFRLFSAMLLVSAVVASGQATLRNGDAFTATGKLQIVHQGWKRYLVLPLDRPYLADFGAGEGTRRITALEIEAPGQAHLVADHAGEVVRAQGRLQLEAASPYYWNGVLLVASAVTLPDGTVLRSERIQPRVPAGTDFYLVNVALVPHQFEWRRDAHDIDTGDLLPDPNLDGCSLNGAGDIMNCTCTPGFKPVRAGLVPRPLATNQWRGIPQPTYALPGMAQFPLADPAATHAQIIAVACQRTPATHRKGSPRQ